MSDTIFTYTASKAKEISTENYEGVLRRNREELDSLIVTATKKGEFKVIYDRQMLPSTESWLNDYGYEVEEKVSTNGNKYWIISWENAT